MKNLLLILLVGLTCSVISVHAQNGPGFLRNPDALPVANADAVLNNSGQATQQTGQALHSEQITPEITELANNLENNPTRIYDYVHNYIKYVHYFGSKKGALLTLLEGSGNDFDQCSLLVALLRAATNNLGTPNVYTVDYQFGLMEIPYQAANNVDLMHWLGLTLAEAPNQSNSQDYISLMNNLNWQAGYPDYTGSRNYLMMSVTNGVEDKGDFIFHRVWVKLSYLNSGSTYLLDPAFKLSTQVPGINVASAAQEDAGGFLDDVSDGATITADYTQNLSYDNLNADLTAYTGNLLADLQAIHTNFSVEQVLSGYVIQQSQTPNSSSFPGLPFTPLVGAITVVGNTVTVPVIEWNNIPTNYISTMRLQVDNLDQTYYFPDLIARKVSLTFESSLASKSLQAVISLDDAIDQWATTGTGATATMTTTFAHPASGKWNYTANKVVSDHRFDQSDHGETYQRVSNSAYVITYGFDNPGQLIVDRQQNLDAMLRQGLTASSPQVITETLDIMGLTWIQETYLASVALGAQNDLMVMQHHRGGRAAQEAGSQLGYYVDLKLNLDATCWRGGNPANAANPQPAYFKVQAFLHSAMEHGLLEQLQTNDAASTVKCLYLANAKNQKLILGTSANASTVKTLLESVFYANPDRYTLTEMDSLVGQLGPGVTMLLPSTKSVIKKWVGYGYDLYTESSSLITAGMIISGGYNGGFSGDQAPVDPTYYDDNTYAAAPLLYDPAPPSSLETTSLEPVNLNDGSYMIDNTDLTIGQAEPRGLSFVRHYDTNRRYVNQANMANGWTHNYNINASTRSDAGAGLGVNSAPEAASFIAATRMLYDEFTIADTSYLPTLRWSTAALIAEWAVDQLRTNAVAITMGKDAVQFIRQPDGSYTPPAGITMTLTKDNGFKLQQRHGNTFTFNSPSNQVASIVDPFGATMTFSYQSGRLATVTDAWGRKLIFTYNNNPAGLLSQVTAHTGMDIPDQTTSFDYGTTYNRFQPDLLFVTDLAGKNWSYRYDADHKVTATIDPLSRVMDLNTYDGYGKVTRQLSQGNPARQWNFYVAGPVSVQKDPQGGRTFYYYDDHNRLVAVTDPNGNQTSTVYDGQDHPLQKITPLGEVTQYIYDGKQNLLRITDQLQNTASFVYDNQFNIQSLTDFNGQSSSFTYNLQYEVLSVTAPNIDNNSAMPNVIHYTYTPNGTIATHTDQNGNVTSYQYDSFGQLTRITDPNLDYVVMVSNSRGDVVSKTDGNGTVTTNLYNSSRQLTQATVDPTQYDTGGLNLVSRMVYDDCGNLWQSIDPNNNTNISSYSSTGKLLTNALPALPDGSVPIYQSIYDTRDWLQQKIDPLGRAVTYAYDAGQRITGVTDPLLYQAAFGYDNDDRQISIQTPLAAAPQITKFGYDARAYRTNMTDPNGYPVQYTYDRSGKPLTVMNRNGGQFTSTYYNDGQLWTSQTPSGKKTTRQHENRGLLASVTKPSEQTTGQETSMTYDSRGRLVTLADPVGFSTFHYDKNDNLLTHTESNRTIQRTFDHANRLKTYTDEDGNQIGYQYDNDGNLVTLTYPGGKTVNYTYDSNNRLIRVTDWAGRVTVYSYDVASQLISVIRPNGTIRTLTYDNNGRQMSILETTAGGAALMYYKLSYDEVGRMKTEFAAPLPEAFTEVTETMAYDTDNRMQTFNGQTVVHDDDGNMTSGPLTSSTPVAYGYDARDRLTSVAASGAAPALSYSYDSEGHRTSVTHAGQTTNYMVDPSGVPKVLVRIDPSGNHIFYVYGNGLLYQVDDAGNTLTYHYDNRGSTVALTSGNGTVTDRVDYNTYGLITARTGTSDTPFLYNGRYGVMTDANGLSYMRARYYNPYLKRFVNADPSGLSAGLNFYAYADGDPVNKVDPFGLAALGENLSLNNHFLIDEYFSKQAVTFDDLANGFLGVIGDILNLPWNTAYGMASAIVTTWSGKDAAGDDVSGWSRGWAAAQVALTIVPLVGELSDGLLAVDGTAQAADTTFSAAEETVTAEIPANSTVGQVMGKLNQYPQVVDARTGANIPFPSGVGDIVPQAQRVSWGATERGDFISQWYQRGYSTPNGGWENYDIHHILPREYGGGNDFWNLVPVQRQTHQELFNSFWRDFNGL